MMTNHTDRSLGALTTPLELALLLALGLGVAAVTRTEPLITVLADARLEPSWSPGAPR